MYDLVLHRSLNHHARFISRWNTDVSFTFVLGIYPAVERVSCIGERREIGVASEGLIILGFVQSIYCKHVAEVIKICYCELYLYLYPFCVESKVVDVIIVDLFDRLSESGILVPASKGVAVLFR